MRITNNVLINHLKNNLSRNIFNMEKIQNQLATGRRINRPSEDPTGIVESMRLSSRLAENRVFQENVKDAQGWLNTTDNVLDNLTVALRRVYELTVQGSNGSLSGKDQENIQAEIEQITEEIGVLANSTYCDKYIFGGTNINNKPYDNGIWQHNMENIKFQVGLGVEVAVNLTAEEVFVQTDMMGALRDIAQHLEDGDAKSLGSVDIEAIQGAIDQVLACRAKIGAGVNRMEMMQTRLEEQEDHYANLQAEVDGIDPALAIMELKNQENVYRASLAVGARVIMPTLVDFLR